MSNDLKRVHIVLDRIKNMIDANEDYIEMFQDGLECMLDDMRSCDAFGSEDQCDPRGDMRDSEYSMSYVQGVDD